MPGFSAAILQRGCGLAYDPDVPFSFRGPFSCAPLFRSAALASSLLAPAAAAAQDAQPARAAVPGAYAGVIPGGGAPPATGRLARRGRAARASILTWPGFAPQGGGRFFVQTTQPVLAELRSVGDRVEVIFRNTTIHLANSRRWLETRHFDTPVRRARLERRGRDMVLVMHMRARSTPTLSSAPGEGGFFFTYIDFPDGEWLPPEPEPAPIPEGSVSVVGAGSGAPASPPQRELGPVRDPMDSELPPAMRGPRP